MSEAAVGIGRTAVTGVAARRAIGSRGNPRVEVDAVLRGRGRAAYLRRARRAPGEARRRVPGGSVLRRA
ncbi:hypothetical protein C0Q92_12035 [Streptomyces albidoflavus]|uniref:Uncharacterized protein n=1 Tax=Streptomyces albidoflavus TaxID=1886 RepID=A0A8G1ZXP6_9ACTN|nr:hypothetical protein SFR_2765 [Streptomyces sp. FR-008]RZD68575.1 hypothetical protein C0Q57_11915 [Streptomyces albidoflavus]RZD79148.1 hypothetical protein C0Q61_11800 [Streptomyces albidoflavus]RZE24203.1 hypothetical protein C0Q92_12035 [Streptomyces albidoflavus]RZE94836.1 hypothetical protein C0R04_11995 [Streptomyces albidoflavus]